MSPHEELEGIAIIGMAGRFPGAANVEQFWANLVAGRDTITRFAPDQVEACNAGVGTEDYVPARGVLEDIGMFDAEYFGIPPREAERMDPQHRIFLEACVGALEDAGYGTHGDAEIGLFAGCSLNTYLLANLAHDRAFLDELTGSYQVGEFAVALGNDKDFLTTRAAYKLDLRGPVVSVQSACATSLVAICQAAQSLLNFQCDMALAGGVSATFPQHRGHVYQEGGIVSSDGHCRPFDAGATGTVFGHGVGVVLLKRLEDAVRDGDHVTAVIRGFAVNNDGGAKAGYMAPGVEGQARVIAAAQAMAGIEAGSISYVEAHGTGTPLGDPVEIAALTRAFRAGGAAGEGFCVVGTAKGNVGHLDSAAGVTGVIKTALSLQHKTLPGLAHFSSANPHIELAGSPFRFEAETQPWHAQAVRRAGVSAFGVGGVNAHVVIEEAPETEVSGASRARQVLCVSGKTPAAALRASANLAEWLEHNREASLADAAFTLACGRKEHDFRIAVSVAHAAEAATQLRSAAPRKSTPPTVAFLFSGQGTQSLGMGKSLYGSEAVYRAVVDECAEQAMPWLGCDLRQVLFGEDAEQLGQTRFAQPAIYVTELALAALWQSWGITPAAMLGHSLGEYVAATLAGVWTAGDGLRLVCARGRLMQSMPPGAMLSVSLSEPELTRYVSNEVSIAAVNAPRAGVLSGSFAAIERVEKELDAGDIATRRLRTSHAFHSSMMQPMLEPFEAELAKLTLHPPQVPFVSSVTGAWIIEAEATSPNYWAGQCLKPVRFGTAVRQLEAHILLEIGIGETLTTLARQGSPKCAVASLGKHKGIEDALADLWTLGAPVDWTGYFSGERRSRISLPTYPFERTLHWIEPPATPARTATAAIQDEVEAMSLQAENGTAEPAIGLARAARLRASIADVLNELSGIATTPDEAEYQFLELGFDSLFLTQATQALTKRFGVKLTFRQMMEEFSSIAALADHFDAVLPPDALAALAPAVKPPITSPAAATPAGSIERLLADQLAAMSQMFADQVAVLKAAAGAGNQPVTAAKLAIPAPAAQKIVADAGEIRMVRPAKGAAPQELTPAQQTYITALIDRYQGKTPGSKHQTQEGRSRLADPRAVAGFRPGWKEMVYPLVTERARGSRIWDVDGNEYIDIVNGYGCIMFGHSPDFVVEAARKQLDLGVAIGPQTPLAGEVAALLCELTGNERVTFCNTGSEAVMAAIRVARTVTGRDRFVYFTGDYHGTFDEVLVRHTPRGSAPVAPGIPAANTTNVVVLEYGADASLAYLREHGDEIAAVLIEPVQTRHPENQPFDFIRAARAITQETGSAFILDEVVTGFRLAPGGVQEFLGIRADMCTYGKVIGGGHPIGVLSGKAMYLDALDGGAWQYGDESGPEVGVTFFAGTFVRHPLALAAARAVLLHLKQAGPQLQQALNAKTAALAERLDTFFVERGVPSRIHHFCSWFYFTFPGDARLGALLYYAMRARGIHIQEGYPCFLTTAHTDADIASIEAAFRETILEMQAAGVLPALARPGMHALALRDTPERVSLTEPQREIWLAAALGDEASCAFNESLTLHLRGPLREADLLRSLETVLARHDALRSTISADGEWLMIGASRPVAIEARDLTGMDSMSREAALVAAVEGEAAHPFDLERGPLVRALLMRMRADHTVLLITAHHIVLDGWSANVLLDELGRLYNGTALGALLPFSSYAALEANRTFDANETFWAEKFRGRSPRLELPVDRPRTLEKSYKGATLRGSLDAVQYADLKRTSAKAGCTLYVTLLAGFQMLLHRLTGQDEVVVGISTAGQAVHEDASLVGHAVHFLPMLSELHAAETATEHLKATRRALLDAYDHQEFTYGSMLRRLKLEREPGRLPLIEVQFNLEKVGSNVAFEGIETTIESNAKRFVNTDLFLNVIESPAGLDFACDYNSDLFDETTIERWMGHWAELLRSLAAAPETRVDTLAILNPAERQQILSQWNDTTVDFGHFEALPASFLRWAAEQPLRTAVECAGVTWNYAELAAYAQHLAHTLVAEGLQPGELVAIAVERSAEMLGALLAVMLAGGAYVPLDPRHPRERLEGVLRDAGAKLLLVSGATDLVTQAKVLRIPQGITGSTASFTSLPLTPESLAYVIYTSGSTGVPKGVAVEHRALVNLLRSMQRTPGLHAEDTLVAITTLAFDIAGLELLLPLLTGAKLVIATDAEVQDGRRLLACMERSRATVLQATPGAWRLLIDAGWMGTQPLKALCGGEALPRELAEKLLDRAAEVWNVYGPTETTIWSSASRVQRGSGPLRIGPPIANTRFYVLDAQRGLAPVGTAGELYIAGEGLARGYWKRPELTAEKFVPNPFSGDRMYATGDLARRHADGTIELLGRTDFQVKVRGYRIELAEIEAALTAHKAVHEAVVVQDGAAGGRLIGYVATGFAASHPDAVRLLAELPLLLARTLPDSMIPSAFAVLETLPRTANGKVDRKALPSVTPQAATRRAFTAPATPAQAALAAIWAEVLEVPQVGVNDSIFELGADSLAIFRIAARAQREGLAVTATQIFQRRTISGICDALETSAAQAPPRVTTRITAAAREKYKVNVDA